MHAWGGEVGGPGEGGKEVSAGRPPTHTDKTYTNKSICIKGRRRLQVHACHCGPLSKCWPGNVWFMSGFLCLAG